mgnify:CR=1 FL=1
MRQFAFICVLAALTAVGFGCAASRTIRPGLGTSMCADGACITAALNKLDATARKCGPKI